MTKKIGIYIGCIFLGFVLSYIIFSSLNRQNVSAETDTEKITDQEWTCAMHPQIKENKNGTCGLCSMDLVLVNTGTDEDELSINQFKMTKKALALANIETSEVGYNNEGETVIKLSGIIETNKKTDATQTSIFEGRVEQLYANYVGTKISKGKQIGLIYSPELYLAQNKLLTSVSYRKTHPELFDEVRNSLGLWKMTDQQIENVIVSERPMTNFPIYADVSGTVTEIIASEGNFYKEGEALFKISDLRKVWAVFDAYESQLTSLKVGQSVVISSSGFSKGSITGKIDFIEPILNKYKRTASVRVVLNNRDRKLKPGMFIEADIKSEISQGIITIPKTASMWTGKRSVVYRKPFPNKAVFEMTEIVLGQSLDNSYEVLSGLEIGDIIVTDGTFTIDAAAQLQGKNSMMRTINDELNNSSIDKDIQNNTLAIDWKMIQKNELNLIVADYLALKDAFVSSDTKMTKLHANEILKTLKKIDYKQLPEANNKTTELLLNTIESLVASSNLKKQRLYFKSASNIIIEMVSKSKNLNNTVFIQFCPMADENKGAKWLSLDKKIMNPYFGDKMLNCGSVLNEIN